MRPGGIVLPVTLVLLVIGALGCGLSIWLDLLAMRDLGAAREKVLAPHGLSLWSFDVLATLWRQPPPHQLTPGELHAALTLSSGAMTNRIDRLESDGLVERHRETKDRRSVLVRLTAKGVQLVEAVLPQVLEQERHRLERFTTDEEREQLAGLLRRQLLGWEAESVD